MQDDAEMLLRSHKVLCMFHFCTINVKLEVPVLCHYLKYLCYLYVTS